jgi:hypothetical protein
MIGIGVTGKLGANTIWANVDNVLNAIDNKSLITLGVGDSDAFKWCGRKPESYTSNHAEARKIPAGMQCA